MSNDIVADAASDTKAKTRLVEAKAYLAKCKPMAYRPGDSTWNTCGQKQYVEKVLADVYRIAGDEADEDIIRWAAKAEGTDMDAIIRWWKFQGEFVEFIDDEGRVDVEPICEGTAPPRKWIVPDWLAPGHVTMLSGSGGAGKTSIALDLAVCVKNGWGWFGEPVTRNGRVLAYFCEDDAAEIQRRMSDSVRGLRSANSYDFEHTPDDLWEAIKGIRLYSRVGLDNHLVREQPRNGKLDTTEFYDQLERMIARQRPALVIIDNAGQVFGGNENDRAQVTMFLNLLNGIAHRQQCAILLLAHPAKAIGSQYSGSTAWENVARSRWLLSISDDKKIRTLAVEKSNYGGYPSMQLAYDPDRRGFVRVVGPTPEAIKEMEPRVLTMLAQLHEKDLAPTVDKARGRSGIWQLAYAAGLTDDMDEKVFKAAVSALVKADRIRDGQELTHLSKAGNRQVRRGLMTFTPTRQVAGPADKFSPVEEDE